MVEINLVSLGMLIVILGIILLLVGILQQIKGKTKVEGGGILFIGPFPVFGVATSKEVFYALLIVSIILIIVFLILGRGLIF